MAETSQGLFLSLDKALQTLLATTSDAHRKRLAGKLAKAIRADQQKRIRAQKNPDDSDYAPRQRKLLRAQAHIRFIHHGKVRSLRTWQASKGRHGRTLTGFDEDKGAVRTFYRRDIERFLDIQFSTTQRTTTKPVPMFRRLRTAHFLKLQTYANRAVVGFEGKAAAIARAHQYGLEDSINELAKTRYPQRVLLGLSEQERLGLIELIYLDLVNAL